MDKLADYNRRRHFDRSPEPRGLVHPTGRREFVVHLRDNGGLHYELGLEAEGVLMTWRLPLGPSLDPRKPCSATRTENRPVEYARFEGVIPEGEPGAGRVLVWDRGSWFPSRRVGADLVDHTLEFALDGSKLSGRWRLVRSDVDGEQWRLIKAVDEAARSHANA